MSSPQSTPAFGEEPCPDFEDEAPFYRDWGLPLHELYRLAVKFYREKQGKAFHLSYQDNVAFIAYYNQAHVGPFSEEKAPSVGALDVIGRARHTAWEALGSMSQTDAKTCLVDLIDKTCSLFRPYADAHFKDLEDKLKKAEEAAREEEVAERVRLEQEDEDIRKERARQRVQDALNSQTYSQFKAYAEQQFPGNPDQQALLIRQLQQQHYAQYMQQVSSGSADGSIRDPESGETEEGEEEGDLIVSEEGLPPVQAASMWTRKDIGEFKKAIRDEGGEAVIRVGHGETVTVRVPTHEEGACLFWEFATDSYDLGFGLHFEWTKAESNMVSVHISDSEDENDEDLDEENVTDGGVESHKASKQGDVEAGQASEDGAKNEKPPTTVIIPVYRRDCHEEVYAGCHVYPGTGVYLLKFDNSYSLWRSKTLYYRVYYTR